MSTNADNQAANLPKASDRIGTGKAFFADHRARQ
jgi:hypothetical protein